MLTPHTLVCEYLADPLGLDVRRPRLSWQAAAERRGARQTAYQVVVSAAPATPAEPAGVLWDSGKVRSDRSAQIEYGGAALQPGQRCAWRVRVWNEDDTPSPWSAPAWWEMGLLESGNWQAVWVTPDWDEDTSRPQPATQLRCGFHAETGLARARL
ncbi:MAG TPA: alpha-L-rhamnosidase, partial [Roseiflexaceae bacterium]|nr:alpha-L-rhamnosidase [Roseiflexaceae bacterium]